MSVTSDPDPVTERDLVKNEIWTRGLHAFGTAFIFERRASRLKKRLRWLTFIALVVPIVIGGLALGYGAGLPILGAAIAIGAGIGILQLVASTWSVIAGWVESYAFAITSLVENQRLARDFVELGKSGASVDIDQLKIRFALLAASDDARQAQDYGQGITESEKRMGHRAALRNHQRACVACGLTPTDMTPTDCAVCGQF